ncbi:MAG: hypothetical protein A3H76_04425 [Candidatus Lloydbacteria bacterium RIFCSPLOWO2_02_FULL_54_12]|nr:MAG: hypothetical protein A3H76_04425 [Candidatus Lloydbacteria bacterium RIFCSPLOWO2_02_FULL_54_12]
MIDSQKSHLLIQNKFLGSLLYFKDRDGRGCLKLSFKNKIAGFVKGTAVPTTLPVPLKLADPISLDVSYKFQDSLLQVKKIVNGKTEREFYKIPLPVSTCLFIIRIKDWHLLDDAKLSNSPLVLTPPSLSNSVAIVFSFLGANGQPIAPREYNCLMGTIDLPEDPLKTFCVGITEDPNNNESNGFIIQIPFLKAQN